MGITVAAVSDGSASEASSYRWLPTTTHVAPVPSVRSSPPAWCRPLPEPGREREAVEGPLVALEPLPGLPRADVHELGKVDLVRAGMPAKHEVHDVEDPRARGERPHARRPGDERARPPGRLAKAKGDDGQPHATVTSLEAVVEPSRRLEAVERQLASR